MSKRVQITVAVCLLAFVGTGTYCLLTDPNVVGESVPAVSAIEPVGKLTPEQKLQKLKERNRHLEFNRVHPSMFAQFFGNLYSNTVGPMLSIMGMVKAAPYVIGIGCFLVGALILSWIYRAVKGPGKS